jgi:hypothetical protein
MDGQALPCVSAFPKSVSPCALGSPWFKKGPHPGLGTLVAGGELALQAGDRLVEIEERASDARVGGEFGARGFFWNGRLADF